MPHNFSYTLLVGTRDLWPAGKGWEKKKKKKKTLVLTLGRSGAYTVNPPEKGQKKKKNTLVLTLGSLPKKGRKKKKKPLVLTLGSPPNLDFRTWTSGPGP
jgi:hypothetical protein